MINENPASYSCNIYTTFIKDVSSVSIIDKNEINHSTNYNLPEKNKRIMIEKLRNADQPLLATPGACG